MNSYDTPLCPVDQQYVPPAGYYDAPYIYVFNYEVAVAGVADPRAGLNFPNIQVPLKGDSQFAMRKAFRYPNRRDTAGGVVAGGSTHIVFTPNSNRISSDPVSATNANFAVVPEMVYPPGGSIEFDLNNWDSIASIFGGGAAPSVHSAQFLFQGVRRFRAQDRFLQMYPRPSTYPYREEPFSYQVDVPVDWAYLEFQAGPGYANLIKERDRTGFTVRVLDYDFELLYVTISRSDTSLASSLSPSIKILLYNAYEYPLFSDFVYDDAINFYTWGQSVGGSQSLNVTQGSFPVPGILYPRGSSIRFDIRSMRSDAGGAGAPGTEDFQFKFGGIRRYSC